VRAEKQYVIDELKSAIEDASAVIFTDYRGTSAEQMGLLRQRLHERNGRYLVVKNRLFLRAAEAAGLEGELPGFAGQVGVAFSDEDASIPVLKALVEFHKEKETGSVLGGFVNRRPYTGAELRTLSMLPPKPVMRAQMLGTLQSVLRGLVLVLAGRLRSLLYVINARIDAQGGLPAAEAPEGETPEGEAEPPALDEQSEPPAEASASE
jgi:large subunit ribosomal protein L10